jgi:hypothetical protein
MKPIKIALAALTLTLAVTASYRTFADDDYLDGLSSSNEIMAKVNADIAAQQQKNQASLDELTRALNESSRQDSIAQQQFLDNRVNTNRLIRGLNDE